MKKIKYEWNQLENDCIDLAKKLKYNKIAIKDIYGVPRGGLIPAVILSHILNLKIINHQDLITKETLIVDDISDSGETLAKINKLSSPTVTLWKDKETKFRPLFCCRVKTKDEWVIFPFETLKSSKKDN